MLVVETIGKVRTDYFVKKKAIKEIARDRKLSRNTVRKIIRSGATEFRYTPRKHQPMPQLESHKDLLDALLKKDAEDNGRRRRTAKSLYGELRQNGYPGAYDSVQRYVRRWRREHDQLTGPTFIPLSFSPADAYQFDWSHEIVVLAGVTTTVKVAHIRLCHSRFFLAIAYPRETQEMVFDAHDRAFRTFGGACARGIYDNMKTAVETVFIGKERRFNRRFAQMCSHYLVEPVACTPASGWEKGQVENQVGLVRDNFFTPRLHVPSLEALNAGLLDRCLQYARDTRHPEFKDKTIWEVFETEKPMLIEYRGPFDGFHEVEATASKTCLVTFDRNKYSIHAKAARRPVQIRAYAERLVVWCDGEIVPDHPRQFGRDRVVYDPWHYLPVLARKPGALRNGAPFKGWVLPPGLGAIHKRLVGHTDGDRQFVAILAAVLDDGLEAVEMACREAVTAGVCSKDAVLNILARHRDGPPPPAVATPITLALSQEPVADCARYDTLRQRPEVYDAAA
ncbi:IS21 family transposase [Azospirillum canadense]|uniref:IS21 family transposase n=1 Tax=Azospirillum canadense TaxID=403962 RepID=UPI002227E4E0|nr:IS21 family transposase [Azospirillum canadense]